MIIGLCFAGYLLTALVSLFVVAYADKTRDPGDEPVGDFDCSVVALFWPVSLLILLMMMVTDLPLKLAERYARKHNLKKKEAQS